MSWGEAIVSIKTANAPLVALVADRFYEYALPQRQRGSVKTYVPAATFQMVSKVPHLSMGPFIRSNEPRIQIDGYVKSERSGGLIKLETLRDALNAAFFGYAGTLNGITISSLLLDYEDRDLVGMNTEAEMDHVQLDYRMHHE